MQGHVTTNKLGSRHCVGGVSELKSGASRVHLVTSLQLGWDPERRERGQKQAEPGRENLPSEEERAPFTGSWFRRSDSDTHAVSALVLSGRFSGLCRARRPAPVSGPGPRQSSRAVDGKSEPAEPASATQASPCQGQGGGGATGPLRAV